MKRKQTYQSISIISSAILLCLILLTALAKSITMIAIMLFVVPLGIAVFAFLILKTDDESEKPLDDTNDWYDLN